MNELRFALRQLLKTPGFTVVAVLTLAIGIACASSMFSGLNALVLEPISYPEAGRLVHVWSSKHQPFSTPDYFDMKDRTTVFEEFGCYRPGRVNLGGEQAQSLQGVNCTSGVLRAYGVAPVMGRLFEPADDVPGGAAVVILSHRIWKDTFAGDPSIIGRSIRVNGAEASVVGVMGPSFEFASPWLGTSSCQILIPLVLKRGDSNRDSHSMCVAARLKPGVTVEQADAEVKKVGLQLKAEHPNTNSQKPFLVRSLYEELTKVVGKYVWMLFVSVILVQGVACANVSSMLLARGAKRQSEFGVRLALGATPGHIFRLAMSESLLLAVGGTLVGIFLSFGGVELLRMVAPVSDIRKAAMVIDGRVLLFTVCMGVITALACGVAPAVSALRVSVVDMLRMDCRGAAGSRSRHRLLRGLIILQIALAFVLANGAALFSASYMKVLKANEALSTTSVLSAEINLQGERYATKQAKAQFFERISESVGALPGVLSAGCTSKLPLEGGSNMNILVNDDQFDPTAQRLLAECSAVTPGYFAAAGIGVVRGRTLIPGDAGTDSFGVVVNRTLADKCWPNQDPLGKVIRPNTSTPWFHARVVGVVESVRQWGPDSEPRPELYWTPERTWGQRVFILLRTQGSAASLSSLLRKELASIDPDLPLARIRTLKTVVEESTIGQRSLAVMVDTCMFVAMGLLAMGLFGTMSYHVLQNTREIGVRMALGAMPGDVLRMVLRQGIVWATIGVSLGVAGTLALSGTLKSMILGLDGLNLAALGGAAVAIAAATLLACWLPARRAAAVDPMDALRAE